MKKFISSFVTYFMIGFLVSLFVGSVYLVGNYVGSKPFWPFPSEDIIDVFLDGALVVILSWCIFGSIYWGVRTTTKIIKRR